MRTEYQKKIVNNLDSILYDDLGFDWKKLGNLVVSGGLPRLRKKSIDECFNFVKYDNHDDFVEIPNHLPHRRSRIPVKKPLDLYHHQRYISLEHLRGVYNRLQSSTVDALQLVELKKRILILENDLELDHNEVVLPGKYYRFIPGEPFLMDDVILVDPHRLPSVISHKFYKSGLTKAPFNVNTPYSLQVFPQFASVLKRRSYPSKLFDPNYWLLIFNKVSVGPSFLLPLRFFFNSTYLKRNNFLIKTLRQHLRQLRSYKLNFYKRSSYLFNFKPLFDYTSFRSVFSSLVLNSVIYSAKKYNRSLTVAKSNRIYILNSVKQKKYRFKIDIKNFVTPEKPKRGVKQKKSKKIEYNHTGRVSYDVGSLNLISFVTMSIKRLSNFNIYSEVPTSGSPYYTRHFRTKRRLRLKDTYAGRQIQQIRDSVFDSIKSKIPVIYAFKPSKKNLSGLALYFLNYNTRHHHRLRSSDSPYTSRQKRLHRLLIVQGVIFEYWVEHPNLMLPGQQVQLQLQNFEIDSEFPRIRHSIQETSVEVISDLEHTPPNLEHSKNKTKKNIKLHNLELKGYYKYKFLIFKNLARIVPYIGIFIRFLKLLLRPFTEIKFFCLMIFDLLKYTFEALYSIYSKTKSTPFFLRLSAIATIWNTSSAMEDSMFDINDHLSANHKYRHPYLSKISENFIPSMDDLSYVDLDDEHPDDYEKVGASRYYRDNFELTGLYDFGGDFLDDLLEFVIVDIPYYLLLVVRPVINFILVYPIWSVLDLVCLLYTQIKKDIVFWYYSFLNSKVSNVYKRLVICTRWLMKLALLVSYTVAWLIYLDYNDLQILIVYTFDITFHDFYYTIYVMFVVLSGLYFFGHHSFRSFIRDELGFENLTFLTFCTGSVVVQNYEIAPKPFIFTKPLYDYLRPKHMNDKIVLENWSRQIPTDRLGTSNKGTLSGLPSEPHYSMDDLEFIVDAQLWRDNYRSAGWQGKHQPFIDSRFERKPTVAEFDKFDLFDNMWYVGELFSDLDSIYVKSKEVKTPITWYNNSEHYYHYHLYNRQGLLKKTDTGNSAYAPDVGNFFKFHKGHTKTYSETFNKTYLHRPGRNDLQSKRLNRVSDPALFGSDFE
jgi:hypothetical protein